MKAKLQYHRHDHLKCITFFEEQRESEQQRAMESECDGKHESEKNQQNSILWIFAAPLE